MNSRIKLVAVIVTYNRLEKLKTTLSRYEKQTISCAELIVVNNCSTDGTSEFLKEWQDKETLFKKHVLTTQSNIGGAGGFYSGMEFALSLDVNWIWVSDDDAYPEENAFEIFFHYGQTHDIAKISAICSSVISIEGEYTYNHRAHLQKGLIWKRYNSSEAEYEKDEFEIDFSSYVGSIYNVEALKQCGLCIKDFFIYYDDSEHSLKLHQFGKLICIPAIRVEHDAPYERKSIDNKNIDWKQYYEVRNSIYCFRMHHMTNAWDITQKYIRVFYNLYWMSVYKKDSIRFIWSAIMDGWKGNLGLHPIYKPGFSIKNEIPDKPNLYRRIYRLIHPKAGI